MRKKGGKLIALFVDLKAAFDSVDKGILVEALKLWKEGKGELIERMEEMLWETKSRVRVGRELGASF